MLKKLLAIFTSPTPEALREMHLKQLRLMAVRSELSLDQVTADLSYIRAAIKRLEEQCSPS
jgi:hypothetical protein